MTKVPRLPSRKLQLESYHPLEAEVEVATAPSDSTARPCLDLMDIPTAEHHRNIGIRFTDVFKTSPKKLEEIRQTTEASFLEWHAECWIALGR